MAMFLRSKFTFSDLFRQAASDANKENFFPEV